MSATTPTRSAGGGQQHHRRSNDSRRSRNRWFLALCVLTAGISLLILGALLTAIFVQGWSTLSWGFTFRPPHPDTARAGIGPALFGTIWICSTCAFFTLPIGVATAILLEEFKPTGRFSRLVHGFIQLNITNLAGVPSVVYGIMGMTAFVSMFNMLGSVKEPVWEVGVNYFDQFLTEGDAVVLSPVDSRGAPMTEVAAGMRAMTTTGEPVEINVIGERDRLPRYEQTRARTLRSDAEAGRISRKRWYHLQLPLGRGVLAGSLTLMLVVLPIVIISSQEALRAVPETLREGAFGMGATPWQVVWNITLPSALPGILTGSILSMSRAIGEAAPILIIAGIVYIANAPGHLMDDFTVLPLQIYNWAQRPQPEFHAIGATGIIVLLTILLSFNALAIFLRQRLESRVS